MIEYMRLSTSKAEISWDDFRQMLQVLLPTNLEDQITLFLRAYVPSTLHGEEIDKYKFTKDDILKLSKYCLEPLFKETGDRFFEELYTNYAMIICRIIGMDTDEGSKQQISLRRLKKNICKAEGYERDMLTLLYGSTGIMQLESKTNFLD